MSENRNDDAQVTGARIGDLPASDKELNDTGQGSGARPSPPPQPWGQPSPEATQPSPEATQPSPDATQPSPGNVDARVPSVPPDPED